MSTPTDPGEPQDAAEAKVTKPIEKLQKEIEKIKPEKEHKLEVKEHKLEVKEKHEKEKLEKEHKEKEVKEKHEKEHKEKEKLEKEHKEKEKVEKPEKEKHDGKEFKAELEKQFVLEKHPAEKQINELGGKELVEGDPFTQVGGDPAIALDPATLLAHADNMVQAGQQLRHFIEQSLRPDLSGGALANEPDQQGE